MATRAAEKGLVILVVGIPVALIIIGAIGAATTKKTTTTTTLRMGTKPGPPKIPFQRGR